MLRWQRLVWLAAWRHRAGAPATAAAYAREAARSFRQAGAFNAAARMADFDAKMAWVQHEFRNSNLDTNPTQTGD